MGGNRLRRLLAVFLALAVVGCSPPDATPEEACNDARLAIGLSTQACTGDAELADARLARASSLPCKARAVEASDYACSKAILAYPCEQVLALGEDLPRWVEIDACRPLFVGPTSGVCSQTADGGCACLQPKEKPVCELPPATETKTPFCCSEGSYPDDGFCVCRYQACAEDAGTCTCSASQSLAGTAVLSCATGAAPAYEECCAGNGQCQCQTSKGCPGNTVSVTACTPQALCGGSLVSTCSR